MGWRAVARGVLMTSPIPPPADVVPPGSQAATLAHLASTVLDGCGHTAMHLIAAAGAKTPDDLEFQQDHAANHISDVIEHLRKLISCLVQYFPEVGTELARLRELTDPGSTAMPPDLARSANDERKAYQEARRLLSPGPQHEDRADGSWERGAYASSRGTGRY